ncbi:MAG: hypothetical protein ACRD1V_19095 [Vicinamibacterales bacterium]
MKAKYHLAVAVALACTLAAGCDLLSSLTPSSSSTTPTSPTSTSTPSGPSVAITAFAGTWQSAAASTPPAGCGNLTYTVTPVTTSSANVTFAATCAGNINVTGSGSGALSGSTITWSATGLVGQGGVNCPFTFNNNTATIDSTSTQIAVNYTGTVCGIPVSGTDTVTH